MITILLNSTWDWPWNLCSLSWMTSEKCSWLTVNAIRLLGNRKEITDRPFENKWWLFPLIHTHTHTPTTCWTPFSTHSQDYCANRTSSMFSKKVSLVRIHGESHREQIKNTHIQCPFTISAGNTFRENDCHSHSAWVKCLTNSTTNQASIKHATSQTRGISLN